MFKLSFFWGSEKRAQSLRTISSHGMMIISETLSNGVQFESDNNAYRVRVLYRDETGIV